jgi:hypothetical protein
MIDWKALIGKRLLLHGEYGDIFEATPAEISPDGKYMSLRQPGRNAPWWVEIRGYESHRYQELPPLPFINALGEPWVIPVTTQWSQCPSADQSGANDCGYHT